MIQMRVNPEVKGMIRSIVIRDKGSILYDVSLEKEGATLYPFEIEPAEDFPVTA